MEKEYRLKVPDTVQRMTKIYHIVGLWKSGNGNVVSMQQAAYFIFFFGFILASLIGIWTIDDADNDVFLVSVVLVGIVQTYRLYFIICEQKRIVDFMHTISINSTADYKTFYNANNKLKTFETFTKSFFGILFLLWVCVISLPPVRKQLIFDIAFPWDYETNEWAFWMGHAYVVATYTMSITIFMFVFMIWYMMLIFVIKYELLASEFRNLGAVREGNASEETVENMTRAQDKIASRSTNLAKSEGGETSYVKNLVEAVKRLYTINGQLDGFELKFSTIFLLQIITSSICICGATFVLAFTHDNFFQDAFYIIEIIYCLADIFAVLYLANEIMLSADKLSYSLFESNWFVQTQSCKRNIHITMEYLKQPRCFVVGKLFPMNIETFIVIVKRSYSMFNNLGSFKQ
ncbi:odorant receptor 94b-like [Bradysia coprophila]|uniref:odorant receptor 94b-like n=1 Tax=Bradysia coprophila TaxID=38358 RepID=UPI00187D74A9|nr:odorant receptor 94b-like [Bradysia coprophila]